MDSSSQCFNNGLRILDIHEAKKTPLFFISVFQKSDGYFLTKGPYMAEASYLTGKLQ